MVNKKSAVAERVAKSKNKFKEAGLTSIQVWVHPEEAPAVRKYAERKPLTKEIRSKLKGN